MSRSGIREALEVLNVSGTTVLSLRCYGLSLSDQYWMKPEGSGLSWEKINFFDNAFSDDMGDVLFGNPKREEDFDFSSPDNTSDGCLKKRWKIIDGRRCLIKGGSNPFQQQPFNEVIASDIMERLGIPHIPYTVMWNGLALRQSMTAEVPLDMIRLRCRYGPGGILFVSPLRSSMRNSLS